jgi:hypothetical protein
MKNQSRKKFIFTGISLAALFTFFKWGSAQAEEKKETVKFLTEDGRLVEIDVKKVPELRQKASNSDVKNWIKK